MSERTASSHEHGAILLLCAFLVISIMLAIGLAIDTTIVSITHSQQRVAAESAVLAGLGAYFGHLRDNPADYVNAGSKASERASRVMQTSLARGLSRGMFTKSLDDDSQAKIGWIAAQRNGRLIPGRFYFSEPEGCAPPYPADNCPCPAPGQSFKPCFKEISQAVLEAGVEKATAMAITTNLSAASPVRTIFARASSQSIQGTETVTLGAKAIAALIPRRSVFVIDLSNSIHKDTHNYQATYAQVLANNGVYSFLEYTDDTGTCPALVNGPVPGCQFVPGASLVSDYEVFASNYDQHLLYSTLPDCAPAVRPPGQHYKSDFRCGVIAHKRQSGGADENSAHLLDTQVEPKPLGYVLAAVHTGLESFLKRGTAGDKVGVIGFDDEVFPDQSEQPGGVAHRTLNMVVPELTDPNFRNFYNATRSSFLPAPEGLPLNDPLRQQAMFDTYLFPRRLGADRIVSRTAPRSDLALATGRALQMIAAQNDWTDAENFIVMFSDGLANCSVFPPNVSRECEAGVNRNAYFLQAMSEFYSQLVFGPNGLVQNKVSFHYFLIGSDSVKAHTLLRKNGSRCLTDEEARVLKDPYDPKLDFVNSTLYYTPPYRFAAGVPTYNDGVFYGANEFYRFASSTGGLWAPIRKPCVNGGPDMTDTFNNFCGGTPPIVGPPGAAYPIIKFLPYTDDQGRLLCDPKNRSQNQQLADYFNQIFSKSPFTLVHAYNF